MVVSPLIAPFRWYDKFFNQDRFDKDCSNTCDPVLISDKRHLLPFQIMREANPYQIENFVLRKACNDAHVNIIPEASSKFDSSTGWSAFQWTISNGSAKPDYSVAGVLTYAHTVTVGETYFVRFTISDVINTTGSHGAILVNIFGNDITAGGGYTMPGVYEVEVVAVSNDIVFTMDPDATHAIQFFLDNVQAYKKFEVLDDDIILDIALLTIVPTGAVDYILYCGADLGQSIPCGKYYAIIEDEDGNVFYSELIRIENFLPEQSPYVVLDWYHTCDLQNVYFSNAECEYKHKLYVDGPLTRPEYPFTDDTEENGEKDLNSIFKKWEKNFTLISPKSPEFFVDALTGIRLHNMILITPPLRLNQEVLEEPIEIKSVECNYEYILKDCYATVNIKMLPDNKYLVSTCCDSPIAELACQDCEYTVSKINDFTVVGAAFAYQMDPEDEDFHEDGYYIKVDDEWILQNPNVYNMVCCTDTPGFIFYYNGDFWAKTPMILPAGFGMFDWDAGYFTINGIVLPNTYVRIETSINGVDWNAVPGTYDYLEFLTGITFPYADDGEVVQIRVFCFAVNCEYGYSDPVEWDFEAGSGS